MDVIALHQSGLRNAVGIMGTSLTEQQVEGLAGLAPTVLLALDADEAGQEAMLRAAKVAASRKLELRVVPMPVGADPADIVERDGAEQAARLMGSSVPLVRFQVERALDTADLSSAEGKDHVIEVLRPIFRELPQSVMRQELLSLVAARLDLTDVLAADLLGRPGAAVPPPAPAGGNGARARVGPAERVERTFLALCIALPNPGRELLAEVQADHFTSDLLRRAAEHLRAHVDAPMDGLSEEDGELLALVRELAVRAARGNPTRETLQVERLQLELARLDRAIAHARAGGEGGVSGLVAQRRAVKEELDVAMDAALAASPPPADD
jgi:DNA primase